MDEKYRCLAALVILLCTSCYRLKGEVDDVGWHIQHLKDRSPAYRQMAAESLGELKDLRAVESLLATLTDSDARVRVAAAEALGQIKDARAVEPLVVALKDSDSPVRMAAAKALGQIKDVRAVDPLVAALSDSEPLVRVKAAKALDQIGGERAAAAFKESEWGAAVAAVGVQVNADWPAVDLLVAASRSDNLFLRQAAVEAMGRIKDARVVDPLLVAFNDSDLSVCVAAVEALGQVNDARGIEFLVAAALKETFDAGNLRSLAAQVDRRRMIRKALVSIGGPAIDPLVAALKDDDPDVRMAAVNVLGQIRDPRVVDPLLMALKDEDRFMRMAALGALGQTNDPRAVDPLLAALKSDPDLRRKAAGTLGMTQIGGERAVAGLASVMPDWETRLVIGFALVRRGWQPQTERDKVYLWICLSQRDELMWAWELTRRVLLEDMLSAEQNRIENAVFTFISLGREEIIPELVNILDAHGNVAMAETYLNCGHAGLDTAARTWANRHGYSVTTGGNGTKASWGSWR